MPAPDAISGRTRVRSHPERADYDAETIRAILDAGLVCHVAFLDEGVPVVLPTTYAPFEGGLVLHGAAQGRMVRRLASGDPATIAVTHVDGLVLARSAMFHSMNYRSVVVFGRGVELTDAARKRAALDALVDHVVPGRRDSVRPPTEPEIARTGVVWFPIDEASAKVRTGPPKDPADERARPVWAGVIPLRVVAGPPEPDPWTTVDAPAHVTGWPLRTDP